MDQNKKAPENDFINYREKIPKVVQPVGMPQPKEALANLQSEKAPELVSEPTKIADIGSTPSAVESMPPVIQPAPAPKPKPMPEKIILPSEEKMVFTVQTPIEEAKISIPEEAKNSIPEENKIMMPGEFETPEESKQMIAGELEIPEEVKNSPPPNLPIVEDVEPAPRFVVRPTIQPAPQPADFNVNSASESSQRTNFVDQLNKAGLNLNIDQPPQPENQMPQSEYKSAQIEPIIQPAIQTISEPVIKPIIVPIIEQTIQQTNEPTVEPIVQPTIEPIIQPVTEPTIEPHIAPLEEVSPVQADASQFIPGPAPLIGSENFIDKPTGNGASDMTKKSGFYQSQGPTSLEQGAMRTPPKAPGKNRRWIKMVLLTILWIVCAAAVICALGYAAFAYVIPPQGAVSDAMSGIALNKNTHVVLSVSITSADSTMNGASFDLTDDLDMSKQGSPANHAQLEFAAPNFAAAGDVIFVNNIFYGKVTHLPQMMAAYSSMIGSGWYSLSMDSVKRYSSAVVSPGTSTSTPVTYPSLTTIYSYLIDNGILSKPAFAGVAMKAGQPVRVYTITIDKDKLASFAAQSSCLQAGEFIRGFGRGFSQRFIRQYEFRSDHGLSRPLFRSCERAFLERRCPSAFQVHSDDGCHL